jgi:hypothetical protein
MAYRLSSIAYRLSPIFYRPIHDNVLDRDRDRAVQWSPPLEAFHESGGLSVIGAGQSEVEPHGVQRRDIGSRLARPVRHAVNLHPHSLERSLLVASDHVHQLYTTGRNRGQKQLDGSDFLTRATVLDRAVDDEMMVAGTAEDASEDLRRARLDVVLANR